MIVLCSLVLFKKTTESLQKPLCIYAMLILNFQTLNLKPSKLREHFNNQYGGADVSGHDVEPLKAKRICFESRGTLPKLGLYLLTNKI